MSSSTPPPPALSYCGTMRTQMVAKKRELSLSSLLTQAITLWKTVKNGLLAALLTLNPTTFHNGKDWQQETYHQSLCSSARQRVFNIQKTVKVLKSTLDVENLKIKRLTVDFVKGLW